jgi:hypothetical protein
MNRYLFIAFLFTLSCSPQKEKESTLHTNHLINETSPYLLQHAHNPVNWYPWSEQALEKARDEDKLMIISIGYAACHWCHVMEKESFEDTAVARLMNEHFISVKIDREERPDIDKIYMDAAILINGNGGWPLNVIALPDSRPVFAGTYYPKEDWQKTLDYFLEIYETKRDRLERQAELITNGIQTLEEVPDIAVNTELDQQAIIELADKVKSGIDYEMGGKKGAPKFPVPSLFRFLLKYAALSEDQDALLAVTITLDRMISGGIYDPVGGGFARYATDERWQVPHFEKMTYDNAQLVRLLADVYSYTRDSAYLQVLNQTLNFINEALTSPEGIFYSSLDADSEGEEGKYYTWTASDLKDILKDQYNIFSDYYNISDSGNWEAGVNILYEHSSPVKWRDKHGISEAEAENIVRESLERINVRRQQRIKPALDDKSITAWNGLMISGLIRAYEVTGNELYRDRAIKAASFIQQELIKADGSLYRNFKDGKKSISGFLDDYAFVIQAYLSVFQNTFESKWLDQARQLTLHTINHFRSDSSIFFYYTSDQDNPLIVRKKELNDAVIPSSNAVMAENLWILGHLLYNEKFLSMARLMLDGIRPNLIESPIYFNHWANVELNRKYPFYEVAIVGPDHGEYNRKIQRAYVPNAIFLGGKEEGELTLLKNKLVPGKTLIYVCREKSCKLPTSDVEMALNQME